MSGSSFDASSIHADTSSSSRLRAWLRAAAAYAEESIATTAMEAITDL
jgi:hypothetical protein